MRNLFDQGATDRVVEVKVTGQEHGNQNVFIRVYGTNTVGADVYKVSLNMCSPGGTPNGKESVEVNRATAMMKASSYHNDEGGSGGSAMTGGLIYV